MGLLTSDKLVIGGRPLAPGPKLGLKPLTWSRAALPACLSASPLGLPSSGCSPEPQPCGERPAGGLSLSPALAMEAAPAQGPGAGLSPSSTPWPPRVWF